MLLYLPVCQCQCISADTDVDPMYRCIPTLYSYYILLDVFNLLKRVFVCMQGINYLVENKLLDGGPESIAEFLYKEEGLNKTAIGEFLGER